MIIMGTNIGKDIDGEMHTWIAPMIIDKDGGVKVQLLSRWIRRAKLIKDGFMFSGDFPLAGLYPREEWYPPAQVADWLTDYLPPISTRE